MRSYFFLIIFISISTYSLGQSQVGPFMVDGNGFPLKWGSTYIADGSPYYHEEYVWAEVTVSSGRVYKDVRIKVNLLDAQVQYLDGSGAEMVTTLPVTSLKFPYLATPNGVFRNVVLRGDTGSINTPKAAVYEVIDSGKISLMKKIVVTSRDEKKFNESVITRFFEKKETDYVLLSSGKPKKLDKSKEFLLEIMADKSKEISAYIEQHKFKCKNLKECQSVISYYNTL